MARHIAIDISDDTSSVKITLSPDVGAAVSIEMGSPQLLELIQSLGNAHAILVASAPIPDLQGQPVQAVGNTKWLVHSETTERLIAVSFYHVRFGPVGFLLGTEQAQCFQDALSSALDRSKIFASKLH